MTDSIPRQRDGLDDSSIQALFGARSRARSAQFVEVAAVLTEIRVLVERPAPSPSPELAAMLEVGLAPPPSHAAEAAPRRRSAARRVRRVLVVAGLSSLVSVPLMGVAAAQDRLPDAAQHVVATVIKVATPFTVADPHVASTRQDGGTPARKKKPRSGSASPAAVPPADLRESKPSDRDAVIGPEVVDEEEAAGGGTKLGVGPQEGPVADGSTPGPSLDNSLPSTRPTLPPSEDPTATPTPSSSVGPTETAPTAEPTSDALAPPPDETATLSDGGGTLTTAEPVPSPSPSPTAKTKTSHAPTAVVRPRGHQTAQSP
jgi:hypothetical protein